MAGRQRDRGSSSESDSVSHSPHLRRSSRKVDNSRFGARGLQEKSRITVRSCDLCSKGTSPGSRTTKLRRSPQMCNRHAKTYAQCTVTSCQHPASYMITHSKGKPSDSIPRIVVSEQSINVPIRPRKASIVPQPLTVSTKSLWDASGGAPSPRDFSPSTASENTDELLQRDQEVVELQKSIVKSQQRRAEFGRRLQELEATMADVRAEMKNLQGRQRARESQTMDHFQRRWQ